MRDKDELEDELEKVAVWEPIDLGDDEIETVTLEDGPPGPEREEAERLLAELRERRERRPRSTGPSKKGSMRYSDGTTLEEAYRERDPNPYADRER